jgi:G3E family GTPase
MQIGDQLKPQGKMGSDPIFPKNRAWPLLVLTGALGAGKTTLLNAALKQGAIKNAAVVVNEFGDVGIDNALIESSSEDVVLLPGGCVCCQVRADLAEALLRLERGVAHGSIPAYERVVIETSGLAEPGPILQLFAESPMLAGRYRLDALVTVVDALLGAAALEAEGPEFRQALLADRLVLAKSESANAQSVELLEARLAQINPHADLIRARRGEADPAWFESFLPASERMIPADALRASHDEAIESFVLEWDAPQPMASLGNWLHALADNHGARLLRVKGIVAVEEHEHAVAVHAIQHLVSPPEILPMPAGMSRVVFIARGLEPGDVRPEWPTAARAARARPRSQAASTPPLPQATGASCAAAARR